MARQQTKAISLVIPIGLYNRIVELANKSRLNPHAYCVKVLWRETGWKPNVPMANNDHVELNPSVTSKDKGE